MLQLGRVYPFRRLLELVSQHTWERLGHKTTGLFPDRTGNDRDGGDRGLDCIKKAKTVLGGV
jgi:hypothetical protein